MNNNVSSQLLYKLCIVVAQQSQKEQKNIRVVKKIRESSDVRKVRTA